VWAPKTLEISSRTEAEIKGKKAKKIEPKLAQNGAQ